MNEKVRLRGISWDHPRGYDPLAKSLSAFHVAHPDIEVSWDKRSLRDFGEAPIDMLADRYDMIVVDHPFCGRAQATGCLIDLKPLLKPGEVEAMLADSVGKSTGSYHYNGGIWGLPTDAAAQVAAYRPDLLSEINAEIPRDFAAVFKLARRARENGKAVALAAVPIDALCMVFTLTANLGHPIREEDENFADGALLDHVLGQIAELYGLCHPRSTEWNPIHVLEAMKNGGDIVYVPFLFGYSNYARQGAQPPIRFADIAGPGKDPKAGALLGGAGCALTHSCRHTDAAMTYLRFLHAPDYQRGDYFDHGGQPGSRGAWNDARVNAASNNFFRDTLETLDKAYLRPRFDGFVDFFEPAGHLVHAMLTGDASREATIRDLQETYGKARAKTVSA